MSKVVVPVGILVALMLGGAAFSAAQDQNPPPAEAKTSADPATAGADAAASKAGTTKPTDDEKQQQAVKSIIILVVGIATVLGLIIVLKINAFIALISAALIVSFLTVPMLEGGQDWPGAVSRVAKGFGDTVTKIGIVIALAAVIGKCLLDSGAADRIVRAFLRLLGVKGSPVALMGSGFVLAIPVFFDTVFYLLVPLARSLHKQTKKNYLMYIMAIGAGGAITHTLVPPTPGPLAMASNLGFDFGVMMVIGFIVALPAAFAGLLFSKVADRMMDVPMREVAGQIEPDPLKDEELPPLWLALLPIVLPVLLIGTNTVATTVLGDPDAEILQFTGVLGNPNLALLLSTVVALGLVVKQRKASRRELAEIVEHSLLSGGLIILITAGGGAFGAMLQTAKIGDAIQTLFGGDMGAAGGGLMILLMAFLIGSMMKIAQGSGTVAMVVGSSMMAALVADIELGFHPVYIACAVGAGSLVCSWMNDSGFWIFAKMGGLTEGEALKSWTVMLVFLGFVSFGVTVVMAQILPSAFFGIP